MGGKTIEREDTHATKGKLVEERRCRDQGKEEEEKTLGRRGTTASVQGPKDESRVIGSDGSSERFGT
jgi:hypothetical protein